MKRILSGLAVIFAATLLLTACTSEEAQVSQSETPSGPDATIALTESTPAMGTFDEYFLMSPNAERVARLDQREVDLEFRADALAIAEHRLAERKHQLDRREIDLEYRADEIANLGSGLERNRQRLDAREVDLEFRADALAVRGARLIEGTGQIARREGDLTSPMPTTLAGLPGGTTLGRCYAFVQIPGDYLTVAERELIAPAMTHTINVPARYETVGEKVLVSSATPDKPEYKTVLVTRMLEPEHQEEIEVPARFQTVTRHVQVTPDRTEMQEVLCAGDLNEARVTAIQRSLAAAGFDPGPIDGRIGTRTMAALNAFQTARGLPVAGYLTIDTVDALGVGN